MTQPGNTISPYSSGVQIAGKTNTTGTGILKHTEDASVCIGSYRGTGSFFNGQIDEVKISATPVIAPEPATLAILGLGALFLRKRK